MSGFIKSRGETLPDSCLSTLLRFHCSHGVSILKAYMKPSTVYAFLKASLIASWSSESSKPSAQD